MERSVGKIGFTRQEKDIAVGGYFRVFDCVGLVPDCHRSCSGLAQRTAGGEAGGSDDKE